MPCNAADQSGPSPGEGDNEARRKNTRKNIGALMEQQYADLYRVMLISIGATGRVCQASRQGLKGRRIRHAAAFTYLYSSTAISSETGGLSEIIPCS